MTIHNSADRTKLSENLAQPIRFDYVKNDTNNLLNAAQKWLEQQITTQ